VGAQKNIDPDVLQAQWVLGGIRAEDLPKHALVALEQGLDGPALRQLAGLVRPTLYDLGNLPEKTFRDLGLQPIDRKQAVAVLKARGIPATTATMIALVESFPTFAKRWEDHIAYWGGEPAGSYNDMAEFVHYVVEDLYEASNVAEVRRVFVTLEDRLATADEEETNVIALGFFETLQNFASWRPYGNAVFEEFMGERSRQVWAGLRIIWAGKSSLMDVIRAELKSSGE